MKPETIRKKVAEINKKLVLLQEREKPIRVALKKLQEQCPHKNRRYNVPVNDICNDCNQPLDIYER